MTDRNVMTDMSKEAMKLALEALERYQVKRQDFDRFADEVIALREALANEALERMAENARELGLDYEPAKQEPVAWMQDSIELYVQDIPSATYTIPLYTSPPAQLKPLTDEQLADFLGDEYHAMTAEEERYFRLAEAAHGIKEQP